MDATLIKNGTTYTVRFERDLPHAPEKVWRALTEREHLRKWFPSDVLGGWEVGSKLQFVFPDDVAGIVAEEDMRGEVLAMEPGRILEFSWGPNSVFRVELAAEGAGSRLILSETIAEASLAARQAAGWEVCLESLDAVLASGEAPAFEMDCWKAPFERYVAKFEPVAGAQQGPPAGHPGVDAESGERLD
jgi:uncharacterized protein YndB with AHSA1/START domain